MKQQANHIIQQTSWRAYFQVAMLLIILLVLLLPACVHETTVNPVDPGPDPDPVDTTGNPIDTTEPATPCDPNLVYFNMQILPILKSNCAKSGCHDAITQQKGVILDSYQNVINSGVIIPFDLEESELFERITENDPDKMMPPPPNQRLNTEQINLIATWLLQGAKDLACDENAGQCDTTNVTYAGFVSPLLTTNCVGCHSGGAPSGGISLNSHAGVQAVALNGRLYGAISHSPGFEPMPRGSAKLPQCTIDKIKAWINDGAPDN